jgi:polyhydroxyalkanoate synthase
MRRIRPSLLAAYDEWIERAEEAYARQVWSDEFCRSHAEMVNSLCALSSERRRSVAAGAPHEGRSLREAVWQRRKTVLYRYLPLPFVGCARPRPVLICYAQVNRPYLLDLEPQCSLVRRLSACGFTVYLLDWGYPDESDRHTRLDEYLEGHLGGCVTHILETERVCGIDLIGVCQGGTLSLCYAAAHPANIANLVLMVTPVDFHTPEDLLSRWARGLDPQLIRRAGNIPGAALSATFLALAPFRLMHQKYVHLMASGPIAADVERFLLLERWLFDSPDQPAMAFSQFLQWFYQENRLLEGKLALGRGAVRLRRIRQPVLNVYATKDRIVPPAASRALRGRVGSGDYSELPVASGHIGLFVSRRTGIDVPGAVSAWLAERGERPHSPKAPISPAANISSRAQRAM